MKIFGNSKNSKHTGKKQNNYSTSPRKKRSKKSSGGGFVRAIIVILSVMLTLMVALGVYWVVAVKPPEVVRHKNVINHTTIYTDDTDKNTDDTQDQQSETKPIEIDRTGEKYTFLAVGMDDGNGNTDTIMVATFDTSDYTLNIVSIPRDTLVNVKWSLKKVNTLYSHGGIDTLLDGISDILGYDVDFYGVINLDAFVKIVDAIGGIDYNVPVDMHYKDPAQDLYIDIDKGFQHLNGEESLKVMRFRHGYSKGDIGRIATQQDFLATAAAQILANKDNVPITTIADIFINDVETDLTYGNCIWFAKELLKMDAENVKFMTIPENYWDKVNGISYPTIHVEEWLEMVNEYLNPFDESIEVSDFNILTRDSSGKIYSTSGYYAASPDWGN